MTDHKGHDPALSRDADRRFLTGALLLIVAFMVAEVVVGLLARSLALLSDAGHMLTDAAAIGLALVALRLADRPPSGGFTYGLKRAEILSAQANGITLLLLAVFFTVEAIRRLVHPPQVAGGLVLVTALAGIVVNTAATWLLSRANRTSLNIAGAFRHIVNDLFAFVGTALAGLVVLLTGWARADALASLLVAGLMCWAGMGLLRDSGRIFLEAAPRGVDVRGIDEQIHDLPGVVDVHDLHVWEVTSGFPALSAHVLVDAGCDCHERRVVLERLLAERFGIAHTTLQVDHRDDTVPVESLRARLRGAEGGGGRPAH